MLVNVFFYIFAIILIFSALRVISAKNPVHSVLFLILAFITSSCLWLMLNVEFLALSLILIYVGAVMVLFLFVVMMLDIDLEQLRKGFWKNLPVAFVLGIIVLIEMVMVIITKPIIPNTNYSMQLPYSNSYSLGLIMYSQYVYPVELASLILLLGLVIAVCLTLRTKFKDSKKQNINKQVAVNSKDRITLVKIDSPTNYNNNNEQKVSL
jgi:NADH-quinone oxidoreductase subunit J